MVCKRCDKERDRLDWDDICYFCVEEREYMKNVARLVELKEEEERRRRIRLDRPIGP